MVESATGRSIKGCSLTLENFFPNFNSPSCAIVYLSMDSQHLQEEAIVLMSVCFLYLVLFQLIWGVSYMNRNGFVWPPPRSYFLLFSLALYLNIISASAFLHSIFCWMFLQRFRPIYGAQCYRVALFCQIVFKLFWKIHDCDIQKQTGVNCWVSSYISCV